MTETALLESKINLLAMGGRVLDQHPENLSSDPAINYMTLGKSLPLSGTQGPHP